MLNNPPHAGGMAAEHERTPTDSSQPHQGAGAPRDGAAGRMKAHTCWVHSYPVVQSRAAGVATQHDGAPRSGGELRAGGGGRELDRRAGGSAGGSDQGAVGAASAK